MKRKTSISWPNKESTKEFTPTHKTPIKTWVTSDIYTHEDFHARRKYQEEAEIDRKKRKNMSRMSKAVFFCIIVLAFHSLMYQPCVGGLSIAGKWFRLRLQCRQCFKKIKKPLQVSKKVKRISGHSYRKNNSHFAPRLG